MINTTTDYSRRVDIDDTVLVFDFDDRLKALISDRIIFETEDSGVAPGPSVGCRIRNHLDTEFTLLYTLVSKTLMVTGNVETPKIIIANEFLAEFPELAPYIRYNGALTNEPAKVAYREC
jgi:hypothetical protein